MVPAVDVDTECDTVPFKSRGFPMVIAHSLNRAFYQYVSDNGTTYSLATTVQNGNVNSATGSPVPITSRYLKGWTCRFIFGQASTGEVTQVPIFSATNPLFVGTSTSFTKDGTSYAVTGRIGEQRGNTGG